MPPLKLATRKRPLSEKIDYSDMMMAGETEIIKKGRGKARAKSGGGSRGGGGAGRGRGGGGAGGRVMDDVVIIIIQEIMSKYKNDNTRCAPFVISLTQSSPAATTWQENGQIGLVVTVTGIESSKVKGSVTAVQWYLA